MNTRRLLHLLFGSALALVALAPATHAVAAQPEISKQYASFGPTVNPYLSAECGFPVTLQSEGFYLYITRYDAQGNPTIEMTQFNFHGMVSANGKSLQSMVLGPSWTIYNSDGTQTAIVNGVFKRNVPGEGFVGDAGHFVDLLTFDANGNLISDIIEQAAGTQTTQQAVCDYLAP